jgi:sulfoxide reductase catalytic subunit YedY
VEPTSAAQYVKFTSILRPEEMRGQRSNLLDWPYREGLRWTRPCTR